MILCSSQKMGWTVHGNGKTDENAFFPDEIFLDVYPLYITIISLL